MKCLFYKNMIGLLGYCMLSLLVGCKCNSSAPQIVDDKNLDTISVVNDSLKGVSNGSQFMYVDWYSYSTGPVDPLVDIYDQCDNDGIYSNLVCYPEYPGGVEAFLQYLNDNLVYPQKAIDSYVRGVIVV